MEEPKKWWKDYLTEHGSLEKAVKISYELWLHKYAKPDRNHDEPKDRMHEKLLIPGKIYTFMYLSQEKINEKTQFIDHMPVILSLGHTEVNKKVFETGIDFNVIPFKIRVFMLEKLYKFYKNTIHLNEDNINEGKAGKKPLKIDFNTCKKLFDKLGWETAYMTFDRTKMGKIKPMDYDDWISIVPLYTKGMRGKQIKDIYEEYIKKMTKPKVI